MQNAQQRSRLRTLDKKIRALVSEGKIEEAKAEYVTLSSFLDRASKVNLVHRHYASRKKSRMALLLNKSEVQKSA